MFDETNISIVNKHTTTNNNEASTGQLVKISKTSKLTRFSKGDYYEKLFFSDNPRIKKTVRKTREECGMYIPYDADEYYKIDILQVLVFGNDEYLVEYEIGEKVY